MDSVSRDIQAENEVRPSKQFFLVLQMLVG